MIYIFNIIYYIIQKQLIVNGVTAIVFFLEAHMLKYFLLFLKK